MDQQGRAAYINAQTACAMIEAMGMQAENQCRQDRGESVAYTEEAFMSLIEKYGIHHNATIGTLHD